MRIFLTAGLLMVATLPAAYADTQVFTASDFSFKSNANACEKQSTAITQDLKMKLARYGELASIQWIDVDSDGHCDLFALTRGGDMNNPPQLYFLKRRVSGFALAKDLNGTAPVIPVYPKGGGSPYLIIRSGSANDLSPPVQFILHWNASRSMLTGEMDNSGLDIISYQQEAAPENNPYRNNAVFWLYIRNELNSAKEVLRNNLSEKARIQLRGIVNSFSQTDRSGLRDVARIYMATIDYANALPHEKSSIKGSGLDAAWVIYDNFIAPQRASAAANFLWAVIQEERLQNPRMAKDYLSSNHFPETNALAEAIAAYRRCLVLDEHGSLGLEAKRRLEDLGNSPARMHEHLSAKNVLGLLESAVEVGTPGVKRQADSHN